MEKIKITRTLLDKPESELSEAEKNAVSIYNKSQETKYSTLDEANEQIVRECKNLCFEHEEYPIPDYGWRWPVEKLCYLIEGLNYDYAKYGLKVVLNQSKEKYATLRFYTHIESKELGILGRLIRMVDAVPDFIWGKFSFAVRRVVDKPAYKSIHWYEITREQYEKGLNKFGDSLGSEDQVVRVSSRGSVTDFTQMEDKVFMVEEDGKYYHSSLVYHAENWHMEPTRHKVLWKICNMCRVFSTWLSRLYKEPTVQLVKMRELDFKVDELVRQAERECEGVCQHCGIPFGEDYFKKCETQGWYMYVCESCAMASGMEYRMGDKFFKEGVPVEKPELSEADKDGGAEA